MKERQLTDLEQHMARYNWGKMPEDVRELVKCLVAAGMIDGRKGLAQCVVHDGSGEDVRAKLREDK